MWFHKVAPVGLTGLHSGVNLGSRCGFKPSLLTWLKEQCKQLFLELSSSYPNHSKIFTDGSKCSEKVAAAAAADSNFKSPSLCRLPDNCSIYTAELHAIHLALRLICQSKKKSYIALG